MKTFRVLFLAKETPSSVPSLAYLLEKGIPVVFAVLRPQDEQLRRMCETAGIPFGTEEDFFAQKGELPDVDYLLSYYWKLVKAPLLAVPRKGSINFHPGPLPEARGSGYHAAILEDWGYWGVTAHWMDATFDTGRIIRCERFDTPHDIVNCDLVQLAHRHLYGLFREIVDALLADKPLPSEPQAEGRYFSLADMEAGKEILATDTEKQIERKIRAYWHPPYMGAYVRLHGKPYSVVSADILQNHMQSGGT